MMEDKIKITIPSIEIKEVEIGSQIVKVNPNITLEQTEIIMKDLRENVLNNPEIQDKYLFLNMRYIRDVLDLCTNIDVEELEGEDFNSPALYDLCINIENFIFIEECVEKEYDKWALENTIGLLGDKMPSSTDMELSMNKLSETIENLPEDKLELISKSIVWNNMPALGKQVAPATHITEGE